MALTVQDLRAGSRYPQLGKCRSRFNAWGYRWQGTLMSQGGFLGAGAATIALVLVVGLTTAPVTDARACVTSTGGHAGCREGLSDVMTGVALVGVALACLSLFAVLLQLSGRSLDNTAGDAAGLWFLTRPGMAVTTGTGWGLFVVYGAIVSYVWWPSFGRGSAPGSAWLGWLVSGAMAGMVATMVLVPFVMWLVQARTTPEHARGREEFLRRRLAALLPKETCPDLRDLAQTGYPPRVVVRISALVVVTGILAILVGSDPLGLQLVLETGALGLWSWVCLMLAGDPVRSVRFGAVVSLLIMAGATLLPTLLAMHFDATAHIAAFVAALATAFCSYCLFAWGRVQAGRIGLWMLCHPLRVARARDAAAVSDELAWWSEQSHHQRPRRDRYRRGRGGLSGRRRVRVRRRGGRYRSRG